MLEKLSLNHPVDTVLLVEDDADFAFLYQMALSSDGYVVKWAADGELGFLLATTWLPHLVFLDMRMPKMTGLEVLQRLRTVPETRELPVVMLSNFSDPEMHREAKELGALDWIVKVDTTPRGLCRWIDQWGARAEVIARRVEDGAHDEPNHHAPAADRSLAAPRA